MTEDQRRHSGSSSIPPVNTANNDPKRWGPNPGGGERREYEPMDHPPQSQMMHPHQQYHQGSSPRPHAPHHLSSGGPDPSYKQPQNNRTPPQHHPSLYQGNKQQMRSPTSHSHHQGMYPPHPNHPPPYMSHPPQPQHPTYHNHNSMPQQHPHHTGAPHHGYNMPPPQMYHQWQHHPYPPQMSHGPQPHGYHPSQQHPYGMQQQQQQQRKKMSTPQDEKKESPDAKKSPSPSPTKDDLPKRELLPLKVAPMRPDFHFFVQDHRDKIVSEAKIEILEHLSLNDDSDVDPYLLYTNLNERLISMWEKTPQATRTGYLVKEEEDRKRFMNAEEVASQHCATLTARAKSPAFVKRESTSSVKTEEPEGEDLTEDMDVDIELKDKEKLKPKSRSSSQVSIDSSDMSPTKKNKVEDGPPTMKEMYGEYEFMPHHSDLSSQELTDMANRIPREPHSKSIDKSKDVEILEQERQKFLNAAANSRTKELHETTTIQKQNTPLEITNTLSKESTDTKSSQPSSPSHNSNKENESSSSDDENDEMEVSLEVDKLLDRRTRQVRGKKQKEYLVRWKGFGAESDSWEPLKNVSHCAEMVKAIDKKKKLEDKEKKEKLKKISDNQV